eukprot:969490-Rhodomonas_salina.1
MALFLLQTKQFRLRTSAARVWCCHADAAPQVTISAGGKRVRVWNSADGVLLWDAPLDGLDEMYQVSCVRGSSCRRRGRETDAARGASRNSCRLGRAMTWTRWWWRT